MKASLPKIEADEIHVPMCPPDAEPELWHRFYNRAWMTLRYDRQYGAMGGEFPISFLALDAYARRYGIEDEAFDRFLTFMRAIDDEWLTHVAERDKEEADKPTPQPERRVQ